MSEITPLVTQISEKIDLLKERLDAVTEEKITLQKKMGELSASLDTSQQEIESLKDENGKLRMAGSLASDSEDGREMKLKINELVREIDKCIALLNG